MIEFTSFLASIWQIFESITVPGLNISFASLWIGCFVVAFSITLLRPIFGIGAGVVKGVAKVGHNRPRQKTRKEKDA